jgi:hypothetical protein
VAGLAGWMTWRDDPASLTITLLLQKHFKNVRWMSSSYLPPFTLLAWLASYDALASYFLA